MIDERLLAPIRRFWDEAQTKAAYLQIFTAYSARLADVTVFVSKSNDGESAAAEVVVVKEDYLEWMEVLETRLNELSDDPTPSSFAPVTVDHSHRFIGS